jgi:hypothetical protein
MYEFTEEGYIKNTVALQNAYDRQTQAIAQIEDAKKQLILASQNIAAQNQSDRNFTAEYGICYN